jgi:hypothetical protein
MASCEAYWFPFLNFVMSLNWRSSKKILVKFGYTQDMRAETRLHHPPTLQANCGDFLLKIIELVTEYCA